MTTTSLAPYAVQQFTDNNGALLSGGKLFTYIAGTTTKQTTYTDSTGGTPNTNPIILNGRGECTIWLTQNQAYKFTLSPSTDTDPPTNAFWTADNIQPGFGAIASGGLLGNSSGSSGVPTPQTIGANLALSNGVLAGIPRAYLSGLTLSNDAITPNTVLDIAAGFCMDSTNTVPITLGAITKTTGGTWVPGNANHGLGNGITLVAQAWYHVFAIINAGNADVYFDTNVNATNAPSGTTAFRRIGSMLTDGSSHIQPFVQSDETFTWANEITSVSTSTFGTGALTPFSLTTPPGLSTTVIFKAVVTHASGALVSFASGLTTNVQAASPSLAAAPAVSAAGQFELPTSFSGQIIQALSSQASGFTTMVIVTLGYIDTRGRFI